MSKANIVYLALSLFLVAHISFRAVARVLVVLAEPLGIHKPPCAQTIINWVTRLSIARIQDARQFAQVSTSASGDVFANGFAWMIDASVGFGTGKVLAVLALDVRHHQFSSTAANLSNVHCIAVSVATSWTGELIAEFLTRLMGALGRPIALIKDGGSDLGKAARLLGESGLPCNVIADVSHVIANLFKHAYGEHPLFDTFISAVGKISQNIKQTVLACLAPPKTSTKARFMNLHRLIKWASLILELNLPNRRFEGAPLKKLRVGLNELPECREYIADFLRDAQAMSECQKILKNSGINDEAFTECQKILKVMPADSSVYKGFTDWLNHHHGLAKRLGMQKHGLPITTDQLESLFGLAKQHGVGELKDANRIALHLPALTGKLTKHDAERVLAITTAMQLEIEAPLTSLTKQRRAIAKNPQDIENIVAASRQVNLEMIPTSKKQENNCNIIDITDGCNKQRGPGLTAHAESFYARKSVNSG